MGLNLNLVCLTLCTDLNKKAGFPPDLGSVACLFLLRQVHELDEQTWRTVEVVPIDIANKEEVAPGVSYTINI